MQSEQTLGKKVQRRAVSRLWEYVRCESAAQPLTSNLTLEQEIYSNSSKVDVANLGGAPYFAYLEHTEGLSRALRGPVELEGALG